MKNFKLTNETIEVNGKTLYRIECIKDFQHAKVGNKGGFVQSEDNLSDEAWIGDDACVFDDARVHGSAKVYGSARVYGSAEVYGSACVFENAWAAGNAKVCGSAKVFGDAVVYGSAEVYGSACVYGNAWVYDNAKVFEGARIFGDAKVNSGDWSETPFQVQGSKHFVNVCSPTELAIGCEMHTLSFWKENFEKIGNKFKYTIEQIKEYEEYINLAIEKYK